VYLPEIIEGKIGKINKEGLKTSIIREYRYSG
jgi:hypothetical protein